MMEEPEENRLDQSLRTKFEDFNLTPDGRVWTGIEQRIAPPPSPLMRVRRPVPLPLLVGLTALLAGLLGWLLPHGEGFTKATQAVPREVARKPSVKSGATSAAVPAELAGAAARLAEAPQAARRLASGRPSVTLTVSRYQALLRQITANRQRQRAATSSETRQPLTTGVAASALAEPTPRAAKQTLAPSRATEKVVTAAATPAVSAESATVEPAPVSVPATLQTLVALERQTLTQLPSISTLPPGTPPAGSHAALLATLRAERAELLRLQRRTDSTLLALGDLPGTPLPVATAANKPALDTARVRPLSRRWSLLLSATPERNTLNLQGPEGDSLTALRRNHETGRVGYSAALLAEYRLTERLNVGAGVGYSTFGADLRITNKNTEISVKYDTTTTRTTSFYTSTNRTYSIRILQIPQLSPVFNSSGQVLRYDTVYVARQDTVFTTTVQRDSTHSVRKTVTPLISKKETISNRLYQPNYRFFTVPVLLRYRLTTGPGRWWADVAAGAQFQFFLGGTQVVTDDGETFRLEKIRAGSGPFRPLNMSLAGSLALNYALTNRLSVSVAPSIRWQALSVYRSETGLRQQPTATGMMFGVRFGL
ncbi:MAG TPA: hypothetical protein VF629_02560 [Hymenobacter sp.]|jgi:hypothetical protein|uniref:hypothetical protein n=1 Tax=Hymenobacter sp. TaxID=1898978 RepID=UPI002ED8BC0A